MSQRGEASRPACQHKVMRFAIDVPNFGDFADPRIVADLARRAEEAGWDGLFVWDHVTHRKELRRTIADPWVLLTAAAPGCAVGRRRADPGVPRRPAVRPGGPSAGGTTWKVPTPCCAAPTRGRPASSSVTRRVDVPLPQGPERLSHLGVAGPWAGLELGAQPVHVGQDLTAQRPALGVFRRVGAEQVGE